MADQLQFDESSSDEEFFDTSCDLPTKSGRTQDNLNIGPDDNATAGLLNAEQKTRSTKDVSSKFRDNVDESAVSSDYKTRDNLVQAWSGDASQPLTSESVDPRSQEKSDSSSTSPDNYADDVDKKSEEQKTGQRKDTDSSSNSEDVDEDGDHTGKREKICEEQSDGRQHGEEHEGLAAEAAEPDENDGGIEEDEDGEEALRQLEETLTQEEKEERKDQAQNLKKEGNDLYKDEEYTDAINKYTEALKLCPLCFKKERAIMFANRAACKVHLKQLEEAVKDCTKALDLHPHYMKVLLRRAQTNELLEKLEEALTDYQRALELDPGCHLARAACMRLPDEIKEKNEKLKAEMMGKLKDLGNMVLRPFGLSTDNFQMQQDPNTGSYSVNFVQNTKTNGK